MTDQAVSSVAGLDFSGLAIDSSCATPPAQAIEVPTITFTG